VVTLRFFPALALFAILPHKNKTGKESGK